MVQGVPWDREEKEQRGLLALDSAQKREGVDVVVGRDQRRNGPERVEAEP